MLFKFCGHKGKGWLWLQKLSISWSFKLHGQQYGTGDIARTLTIASLAVARHREPKSLHVYLGVSTNFSFFLPFSCLPFSLFSFSPPTHPHFLPSSLPSFSSSFLPSLPSYPSLHPSLPSSFLPSFLSSPLFQRFLFFQLMIISLFSPFFFYFSLLPLD